MTGSANEGSAAGAAGQSGNPENANAGQDGGAGSASDATAWLGGLQDEGNRKLAEGKGWKSMDDGIKSYKELETAFSKLSGEALKVPADDAPRTDWDAFFGKLGRPEKADGYTFKVAPDVPADFPYSNENAAMLKNMAFEFGLTPRQAQGLHDGFVKTMLSEAQVQHTRNAEAETKATAALEQEWGASDTAGFRRNVQLADRAMQRIDPDLKADLIRLGAVSQDGAVRSAPLARALAKIGNQLFTEDALYAGAGANENPWSDATMSLTRQGQVIQSNPNLARQWIVAAGKKPADYGL